MKSLKLYVTPEKGQLRKQSKRARSQHSYRMIATNIYVVEECMIIHDMFPCKHFDHPWILFYAEMHDTGNIKVTAIYALDYAERKWNWIHPDNVTSVITEIESTYNAE